MMVDSLLFCTVKAMRAGILLRMRPENVLASGRWVASTKWIPAARAFFEVRDLCLASSNEMLRRFGGRYLVPLSVAARPEEWA